MRGGGWTGPGRLNIVNQRVREGGGRGKRFHMIRWLGKIWGGGFVVTTPHEVRLTV